MQESYQHHCHCFLGLLIVAAEEMVSELELAVIMALEGQNQLKHSSKVLNCSPVSHVNGMVLQHQS